MGATYSIMEYEINYKRISFCGKHIHLHLILTLARKIHRQENFLKGKTAYRLINHLNLCGSFPRRLHFTVLTLLMHTFAYLSKPFIVSILCFRTRLWTSINCSLSVSIVLCGSVIRLFIQYKNVVMTCDGPSRHTAVW